MQQRNIGSASQGGWCARSFTAQSAMASKLAKLHLGAYIEFASRVVRHARKVTQPRLDVEAHLQVVISIDNVVVACQVSTTMFTSLPP